MPIPAPLAIEACVAKFAKRMRLKRMREKRTGLDGSVGEGQPQIDDDLSKSIPSSSPSTTTLSSTEDQDDPSSYKNERRLVNPIVLSAMRSQQFYERFKRRLDKIWGVERAESYLTSNGIVPVVTGLVGDAAVIAAAELAASGQWKPTRSVLPRSEGRLLPLPDGTIESWDARLAKRFYKDAKFGKWVVPGYDRAVRIPMSLPWRKETFDYVPIQKKRRW